MSIHDETSFVIITLIDFNQHDKQYNLQQLMRNEIMVHCKERVKYLSTKLMYLKQIRHSNIPFIPSRKPFDFSLDRDVAFAVIDKHGVKALKVLNENWRNDRELILKSILNDEFASIEFIGKSLKKDFNFVKELVEINWVLLKDMKEFRKDEEICRAATSCNARAIQFVENNYLLNNREYILNIVRECGLLLKFVGDSLKNDREINLTALDQNSNAYHYVGSRLIKDDEILKYSTSVTSFELSVKSLHGTELKIYVNPSDTFKMIRWMLYQILNYECILVHNSKILLPLENDDKTLEEMEINKKSSLTMRYLD